jgi:hypothetical protein
MEVDERGHNRFSANVLHIGVFRNGHRPSLSGDDDMIAFDDEHGILDCWSACPINQARPFKHDLSRLGLSASAGASNKHG